MLVAIRRLSALPGIISCSPVGRPSTGRGILVEHMPNRLAGMVFLDDCFALSATVSDCSMSCAWRRDASGSRPPTDGWPTISE